MKPTGSNLKKELQKNNFNIVEILYAILAKWYWFVIALVFTVGYSLYNISRIEPTYTRHTEILIKGTQKGTSIEEQMEAFANIGLRSTTSAYNEIYTFRAPETTIETARRLKLYVEYSQKGKLHPTTLYGSNVPVHVEFCDINIQITYASDFLFQNGQFVVVGRKQGSDMGIGVAQIFYVCPGDGKSVIGAGAAADFVQDN